MTSIPGTFATGGTPNHIWDALQCVACFCRIRICPNMIGVHKMDWHWPLDNNVWSTPLKFRSGSNLGMNDPPQSQKYV